MAEEDGGRGGGLGGTVTLPGVGPVKKKIVIGVGGAAAAFVLWRYWQARQAGDGAVPGDSDGDGFADGGTLPSVSGAVREDNGYGLPDGSGTSSDSYGFSGTTNSQWTQYAATQLSAASDKWSYGDVLEALGQYLNNRPLTSVQQQIVQAAIAAAGPPPEGTHPIIPGGDTALSVAPKNLRAWDTTTSTQIGFQWDAVPGATQYRIYRTDLGSEPVGHSFDTKFWAKGLRPNSSYSFQVEPLTASNKPGPKSATYTAKTKTVTLAKPSGVRVSSVSRSTVKVTWNRVAGADYYRIYINGANRGSADKGITSYTVTGLKPNTAYKVSVAADTTNQTPGPQSGAVSFRTKK